MRTMKEDNLNRIENYINQYIEDNNGESPSLTNIMNYTGMVRSTVYRHILELQKRGKVLYSGKNTLGVNEQDKKKVSFSRLAILGTIPCGIPEDYKEEIEGYVAIPSEWIEGKCYLLKAKGDSMIDIGIDEGDLVLVNVETNARNGQVIAVLTDEGTTLKRYMVEKDGRPWLLAENNTYSDEKRKLYPENIQVLGIALKVIKNIK